LVERPKRGFAAPIAGWLRGPLRAWAESLLEETRLRRDGYFEPGKLRQRWREHLSGKRDWSTGLWHVLMFQAWVDQQPVKPKQTDAAELAA
jgi:asparagine synthase (glutamine-hydrolysing)